MDQAEWNELVRRWDQRDARWDQRDKRWEERDKRWEERDSEHAELMREHKEFMREMWRRIEQHDIRSEARHADMMDQLQAMRESLMRMLDRLGEGPHPAS